MPEFNYQERILRAPFKSEDRSRDCFKVGGSCRRCCIRRRALAYAKRNLPIECFAAKMMLTPRFAIVFQLPHHLLFDFVHCIVSDWRLAHGGRWQENHVFIDGIEFGLERNLTGSLTLKTRSFEDFVENMSNWLNQFDSSTETECTVAKPAYAVDKFRSESSTSKRKTLRETAPSFSGSSGRYKRVKKE